MAPRVDSEVTSAYAPERAPERVAEAGEFVFAAMALDHAHIHSMCDGLIDAGGTLRYVWDANRKRADAFAAKYPGANAVRDRQYVLQDTDVRLVAAAAVPSMRADLGIEVMNHSKDYFTDKAPLTTLEQLARVRAAVAATHQRYMVYYSERLHAESAVFAGQLVDDGAIGRVVQVMGLGPHFLGRGGGHTRPDWFFRGEDYGGIVCDLGSHQIDQYLTYAGECDARIAACHVGNMGHPEYPELEDFGEALLVGERGSSGYFRVDWLSPDGLSTWGDSRTVILGTDGYVELRKNVDIARQGAGDHVYIVDGAGEHHIHVAGRIGYPYFGRLIRDCIDRTETAMTQDHALKVAEIAVRAQLSALRLAPTSPHQQSR